MSGRLLSPHAKACVGLGVRWRGVSSVRGWRTFARGRAALGRACGRRGPGESALARDAREGGDYHQQSPKASDAPMSNFDERDANTVNPPPTATLYIAQSVSSI